MMAGSLTFHKFSVTALRVSCEMMHRMVNLGSEVNMTCFGGGDVVIMGALFICRGVLVAWGISSGDTGVGTLVVCLGEILPATIGGGISRVLCHFGHGTL